MKDAVEAGGQQYAELCAASYRQAVAAHKLVLGPEDELFFFQKRIIVMDLLVQWM